MGKIFISLMAPLLLAACDTSSPGSNSSANSAGVKPVIVKSNAVEFTPGQLKENAQYRRAVEAAIWGMPIVATNAIRQGYRDLGAEYNDIVYLSKVADWKFQTTTPNASTHYIYSAYSTEKDGPIVVEVPAAIGAGIYGQFCDMWDVPLAIAGPGGSDKGKGGKYLILPPGYKGRIPGGFFPISCETFGGFWLMRTIPKSNSPSDQEIAVNLIKKIRVYPLAKSASPPDQRYIDASGKLWNGIPKMDEGFYRVLSDMVNEEPVLTKDLAVMNMLRTLGIEKGRSYNADAVPKEILKKAIDEAKAVFVNQLDGQLIPFWKGEQWALPDATGVKTEFSYVTPGVIFDYDNRGMLGFYGWAPPMKADPSAPTIYLQTLKDKNGKYFSGDNTYRLNVPANVPARQYWSVTVYDFETAGFIANAKVISLDSYNRQTKKNADGSVDIYFSPEPPAGMENNWVSTARRGKWFPMFRFYGPEKGFFDKTWKMGDVEEVK